MMAEFPVEIYWLKLNILINDVLHEQEILTLQMHKPLTTQVCAC